MPSPQGSPLKSFTITPTIRGDGKPTLKATYIYEDGFAFETKYSMWAVTDVNDCARIDLEPPLKYDPETGAFEHAWPAS